MECVSREDRGEYHARQRNEEGAVVVTYCGERFDTSEHGTRVHQTAIVARQMATREGKEPCVDCLAELGPTASAYFVPRDRP
jgi:hypothetical protein